jgi:hypothetical protein
VDARRDDPGDQMLEYRRGYHGAVSAAQRRRISLTVYGISPQSLSRMVTAFANTSTLSKGTDSLTAVFTPTKPTGFGLSTSPPLSQTVNTLFGFGPEARVRATGVSQPGFCRTWLLTTSWTRSVNVRRDRITAVEHPYRVPTRWCSRVSTASFRRRKATSMSWHRGSSRFSPRTRAVSRSGCGWSCRIRAVASG